ncbi:MAG: translation elongation factor 4 [Candidatus Omnitrophica bacterium]|nr:translation elongation factor 4 [Candidatus Omnitrophota bacterium]MDD5236714.1 translation elongation factor 4 [Candidatus Omnitrophota bacterium]MDD5610973.1 translation elongation factor 4 [Candidatus Omnitrophota bacterium]
MDNSLIRNFSIIAHIDHGKSTLADRILELTGAVDKRHTGEQLLDDMELEKERGITIKASAVRLSYTSILDNKTYVFNLIDTPGHVDFTYEVAKSLTACEGALLLVDAAQGIEAQTVANFYLAQDNHLKIIPVINKIDMASADVPRVKKQLVEMLHFKEDEIMTVSAKDGTNVLDILERIIEVIPAPKSDLNKKLRALVFDCRYDVYKGVVVFVKVIEGKIVPNQNIRFMQTAKNYKLEELGIFKNLKYEKVDTLEGGEVGYFTANMREPKEVAIGDTLTDAKDPAQFALPGFRMMKPLVFCGIYPVNAADFANLRQAIDKLKLSDASFVFEQETSVSFGYGFRCGFLGLLHMEIVQERLEREYNLNLILTVPNVVYRVKTNDGSLIEVDNPVKLPEPPNIDVAEEPYADLLMIVPTDSIEPVCELAKARRGTHKSTEYIGGDRVELCFEIPLSEIIVDFYDRVKSMTRGYGSIDYEFKEYRVTEIVRLDILINSTLCDAFSSLVHKDKAQSKGRMLVEKLKELIPRQLFEVSVQAAVGSKIIAADKVRAMGKHVTAKCYGGDITRKRKLWEKQKSGKKRLKQFGRVEIPQEAFLEVLRING